MSKVLTFIDDLFMATLIIVFAFFSYLVLTICEAGAQETPPADAGVVTVDAAHAPVLEDFGVEETTPDPDAGATHEPKAEAVPETPKAPEPKAEKPAKGKVGKAKKGAKKAQKGGKGKKATIRVSSPSVVEENPKDGILMSILLTGAPLRSENNRDFPKVWKEFLTKLVEELNNNPTLKLACVYVSGVEDDTPYDLIAKAAGGRDQLGEVRARARRELVAGVAERLGLAPYRVKLAQNVVNGPSGHRGARIEVVDNCLPPPIELSAPNPAQDGRDGRDGLDGRNGSQYFFDFGTFGSFAGLWSENSQINGIGAKISLGHQTDWTYVRLGLGGLSNDSDRQENTLMVDGAFGLQLDWAQLGIVGAYSRSGEALDANWESQSWGLGIEGVACTSSFLVVEACLDVQFLPLGESWTNLNPINDPNYVNGVRWDDGTRDWTGTFLLGGKLRL